jgi:putative membrane protein insertion efficiency factor
MRYFAVFLITLYKRMISPLLPPACRFFPTCSDYAKEAFLKYGFFKGFVFSIKRLSKCHPFHPGGYDPLP